MSNRIYDLARQLNVPSRDLITMLEKHGIEAKSHMNTVDDSTAALILETFGKNNKGREPKKEEKLSQEKKPGSRTYIPPRQRLRKRPGMKEKPGKPRPSLERGRETGAAKREAPSQAEKPPKKSPSHQIDRHQQAKKLHKPEIRKKRKPSSQMKTVSRAQVKETPKEKVEKATGFHIPEKTRPRPSIKSQQEKPTSDSGRQKRAPRRPASMPQEKKRKKEETVVSKQPSKPHTGRYTQKKENVTTGETAKKRSSVAHQKESPTAPHYTKRPHRKPVTKRPPPRAKAPGPKVEEKAVPQQLEIPEMMMVKELAEKMNIPPAKIVRHLMTMGIMATVNQVLETKAAMSIAEQLGFEVKAVSVDDEAQLQEEIIDKSKLKPRSPVVTIMGHVDHGKTTLLDAIRESKITDTEFGGITQHIGAYTVDFHGHKIVFLDTPGHEAFTAMRARGARVTDEVILVVAADDGIMPQTIEAIDHARAAHVPIIVAINKIDLPGANPDRVMQELTKHGLTPEEWGGETICVKVSAKARTNLDELLEMILLQAEMLELRADPDRHAQGVIVEALLDKGRGPVATVLVQNGTLRVGDPFVVGLHYGKVRAMLDDRGKRVDESAPASPVEVLGLTGVPVAGDSFVVMQSERKARQTAESRQEQQQTAEFAKKTAKITLEELHHHIKEGEIQELRIIIKADVHGSVEALNDALERLSTGKVRLQVIHGGVGAINESDVMLATASNAIVLGFNVRPVAKARDMAEKEQIDVRLYTIIYQAIDDIKKAMEGLLEPTYKEVLIGQAQVLAVFSLSKVGMVAGCRVTNGKILRNSLVRLLRDKTEVFKGNIASLRRVKDDVREVLAGYECGIRLENFNKIEVSDVIEAYTLEKVIMTLEGTIVQ